MFLKLLQRRNPALIDAAVTLHQQGVLPSNTYVIDLDAVGDNARAISTEADRLGLTPFAMTKQVGRNPDFCRAVIEGGIPASVNVDMECARATWRAGMRLGHLGHLVQVPRQEAAAAAAFRPQYWTVFNDDKADEAAAAAQADGYQQALLARIRAAGDEFYTFQDGGYAAEDIVAIADRLDGTPGARFAGITTFPALLFDAENRTVRTTHNLATLERAAETLRNSGRAEIAVNAPGTTSTATLPALAQAGATQVEPGHALTGTTPWHAEEDLVERPAVCYVSEISHLYAGKAACFGGGLYVDPVRPPYQIKAVVGARAGQTVTLDATLPPSEGIDYYGHLDVGESPSVRVGDSVVFGFRIQAFVTRAYTAGISGISAGRPRAEGLWAANGSSAGWPR